MARTVTAAFRNKITGQENIGLVTILKIDWSGSESTYHGDKEFAYTGVTVSADLLEIGTITYRKTTFTSVIAGTVNVRLVDKDQVLYNRLKSYRLVKTTATIYLYLEGQTAPDDFVNLYSGEIATPIQYDEITGTLSFDIIPLLRGGKEIPFAASEDGGTNADNNTQERFWGQGYPTAFGRVVDVPAQLVKAPEYTYLASAIDESNNISVYVDTEPYDDSNPLTPSPAGASVDFLIDEERVTGYFGTTTATRKQLNLTARNLNHGSVTSASRPSTATDPDASLSNVMWVQSAGVYANRWFQMTSGNGTQTPRTSPYYNFCYKQEGTKLWFQYNWATNQSPTALILSGCTFTVKRYSSASGNRWTHQQRTPVTRWSPHKKTYVFCDTPLAGTSDIVRVRAWRNVPIVGGPADGQVSRQLVQVPSGYYTIYLGSSSNTDYQHALVSRTTHRANYIVFDPPLSFRHQGWEDDVIYVSLAADIATSEERNPAQQIKYILENYTELTPDATSFAAVQSQIGSFDADYVLTQPKDAMQVCADIAWQARCALIILGKTVKIKYLSVDDPGASGADAISLTDANVCLDGVSVIELSEIEDIVTVFIAKYKKTYAEGQDYTSIKRINTAIFRETKQEYNFFIYQRKSLVNVSRDFWAGRYGNNWKLLRVRCLAPAYEIEPYDFINIDIRDINDSTKYLLGSTTSVRGVVEEQQINDDGTIDLTLWTPVIAGTADKDSTVGWKAAVAPTSVDPLSGMSQSSTDKIAAIVNTDNA